MARVLLSHTLTHKAGPFTAHSTKEQLFDIRSLGIVDGQLVRGFHDLGDGKFIFGQKLEGVEVNLYLN